MVEIARALATRPRILLLDEPSLGLAPAMIDEIYDALAELRDDGVTILLVDQMATLALTVADRGYVLESGHVVRADSAAAPRTAIAASSRAPASSKGAPCAPLTSRRIPPTRVSNAIPA